MPLEADQAVDRRRLKRRLSIWRAAAVIAVAALAVVVVNRTKGTLSPFDRPHVERLSVDGVISEDPDRSAALKAVEKNDRVKALIVSINSPGGTVVGSEELFRELRAIAAKKPVVAVMGTLAASGGYMTALGADHIVARDGTITGSIGVIMQTADVTGLLKKLGIEPEAIKSAPLKAVPSPLEPLTDEGREATRGLVLDMYDMFVTMVADRRGLDADVAKKLADGRVYTGRQALAARLIDEIGGEDEARAWLESAKGVPVTLPISDVRIEKENKDLLGLVGGSLGKALFSERLTLDGLLVLWHP
ncbi:MAG TPA: signal peptide peptidase SppA [Alphaproteobacteria bacterium]|jgi:protease-4|nr:signal peptide peptidase SppA [Alphaproteobacteria bacterium]